MFVLRNSVAFALTNDSLPPGADAPSNVFLEISMIFKLALSAAFIAGLATSAAAGVMVSPISDSGLTITRVAEGCGPGMWRGPHGGCHPFARHRMCPRGFHIGPHGKRCWPN
jgi:hypothetical protein